MATQLLPRVRPTDLHPALHPARPFDRARLGELVNAALFYGILGFGVLVPVVFALYAFLFR